MAMVKASNVLLQSTNAQRAMNAMHDKLIAEGFTWDGADGYSISVKADQKCRLCGGNHHPFVYPGWRD